MDRYMTEEFGNPNSIHQTGVVARNALEDSRKVIALAFNSHPDEIIFNSGGTEGNNAAIFGVFNRLRKNGVKYSDMRAVTTNIEHSSVLPELVLMDKGFDSQPLHTYLRDVGVWSVAPVRKGCAHGHYRKQLRDCFDWPLYWQRSIIECLFSAVKRLFGSHVRARTARMQRAEISSKFIAYNIGAILFTIFYRAGRSRNFI